MRTKLLILAFVVSTGASGEQVWKKNYWAWGQGATTSSAATQASVEARPVVAALRAECDVAKGIVTVSSKYGICATSDDPMFCKHGCYTCPLYGTATCTIDVSGKIKPGAFVEATVDAKLYSGSSVVGHVTKGERFHVIRISNQWASLEALDGTPSTGWIRLSEIALVAREGL